MTRTNTALSADPLMRAIRQAPDNFLPPGYADVVKHGKDAQLEARRIGVSGQVVRRPLDIAARNPAATSSRPTVSVPSAPVPGYSRDIDYGNIVGQASSAKQLTPERQKSLLALGKYLKLPMRAPHDGIVNFLNNRVTAQAEIAGMDFKHTDTDRDFEAKRSWQRRKVNYGRILYAGFKHIVRNEMRQVFSNFDLSNPAHVLVMLDSAAKKANKDFKNPIVADLDGGQLKLSARRTYLSKQEYIRTAHEVIAETHLSEILGSARDLTAQQESDFIKRAQIVYTGYTDTRTGKHVDGHRDVLQARIAASGDDKDSRKTYLDENDYAMIAKKILVKSALRNVFDSLPELGSEKNLHAHDYQNLEPNERIKRQELLTAVRRANDDFDAIASDQVDPRRGRKKDLLAEAEKEKTQAFNDFVEHIFEHEAVVLANDDQKYVQKNDVTEHRRIGVDPDVYKAIANEIMSDFKDETASLRDKIQRHQEFTRVARHETFSSPPVYGVVASMGSTALQDSSASNAAVRDAPKKEKKINRFFSRR